MTDLEVAEILDEFGALYTVTRLAAATYVNGVAQQGATSTLSTRAALWPAQGRDLERLPEGRRSLQTLAGVADVELLVGAQGGANEADLVAVSGVQWEVQRSGPWPNAPGFWSVILQRPNVP